MHARLSHVLVLLFARVPGCLWAPSLPWPPQDPGVDSSDLNHGLCLATLALGMSHAKGQVTMAQLPW